MRGPRSWRQARPPAGPLCRLFSNHLSGAAQIVHHTLGKPGVLDFELQCFTPVTCYQVIV